MRIKDTLKSEQGSIPVLVALSLTVLFGFCSFAVDFGMMASCRQSMQNAADAAALAAAADLSRSGGSYVSGTAATYCRVNGFDPDDETIDMEVSTTGSTVTVTLHREMGMGFSAVLTGDRTKPVSATATAEAVSIFGSCPYAMFAGQRIEDSGVGITIGGNNIVIDGNIHSNSDISMSHAVLTPGVVATAVRTVNPATSGWNGGSIALDMPRFSSLEAALSGMPGLVTVSGNVTLKKNHNFQDFIDEAVDQYETLMGSSTGLFSTGLYIYVTGNLVFNGNSSSAYSAPFPIVLIVNGNIDLNGAPLNSTADNPMCIMSKTGNITVNGGGETFTGIVYAPNGDVTLNGNSATFAGSIVAQNIRKNGGKITVSYRDNADRFLPRTRVHLIA